MNIDYKKLADGKVLIKGVPDGNVCVDVVVRQLTRRDRDAVRAIDSNSEFALEQMLSLMIAEWDGKPGITSLELCHESKDEAVEILQAVTEKFFQKSFKFTEFK